MAMAKPVLCSEEEASTGVIRDQNTGYTFPAVNIQELKSVLKEKINSRAMLTRMGERARQEAVNHHSWNRRVDFMYKEIQRILGFRFAQHN